MQKLKSILNKNKRLIFILLISFLYTILLICLSFYHENWRDEAQAWLICRDLSFINMIKQITIEGHPILWYLILFPLTKLGLPYHTMNIISCLLVGISIFLLLKKAPFHPVVKILIMLSIPFLYEYSIIARNYSLISLIIMLIAINHSTKNIHPYRYGVLLILLINTHSLMLGLGILLLLEWIIEYLKLNKKQKNYKIIFSILITILILILTITFYKHSSINNLYYKPLILNEIVIKDILIEGLNTLNYFSSFNQLVWYKSLTSIIILIILSMIFILLLIFNRKQALIFSGAILFQWVIYTYIVYASHHRIMTLVYIIILCTWLAINNSNSYKFKFSLNITLFLLFLYLSFLSFTPIKSDFIDNYSSSKDMGQYLTTILKNNDKIIGIYDTKISSILPYLDDKKAWSPITNEYYSFINWDSKRQQILSPDEMFNNIKKNFSSKNRLLYIYAANENDDFKNLLIQNNQLILLYKTKTSISGEQYELYELKL